MPDNKQLIERLRERAEFLDPKRPTSLRLPEKASLHREAADTIERLEAEVGKLREQLEKASTDASVFDKQRHEAEAKLATLEAERERDAAVLEALRASVADAIDKLAGPLGRAHVRAETGSDQDKELAEVVEQIGVIREAIEPGITEAINALQHAQEQVGEAK